MRFFLIIFLASLLFNAPAPDLYVCKNAKVVLFSKALIEDIQAVSQTGVSVYSPASGELNFAVTISTFQFEKALMQEHFNSDYMESDKYPRAIFKGKLNQQIDVTKDGTYQVTATGELTIHGITTTRTLPGVVSVKNGIITITAEFIVSCGDHRIDIPQILFYHIAESIQVTLSATYSLYTNNSSK